MCWSSGMVSSPTRRVSCPSRSLSLVCKRLKLLLGLSETNTIGYYKHSNLFVTLPRAHAAVRTKGTYFSALYQRLAARRGKPRTIIAVAHSMMRSVFHMLSRHEAYRELGANYFDER